MTSPWSSLRTFGVRFELQRLPSAVEVYGSCASARLRECDYGRLTRLPFFREIEDQRAARITTPFPEGESYQQVAWRVATWLDEVARDYARRTVLVVGHRATFYALEHLVNGVPLHDAVLRAWLWQPGWVFLLTSRLAGPSVRRRAS